MKKSKMMEILIKNENTHTHKHSHPQKQLRHYSAQAPAAYTHKSSRTTTALTSALYPPTTVHRHSPRKPHATFDHLAWRREPDVAHLLSIRVVVVGWGVEKLGCGAFIVGVGCLSPFFERNEKI